MSKKKTVKPQPQLVKKSGERKMPKTDVQKFLDEEKARKKQKEEMIQAVLQERDEKLKEYDEALKLLGYVPDTLSRPTKTGIKRPRNPDAICKVCNFKTEPSHDSRKHRSQGKTKKPFTTDELVKLGLQKVN